MHAVIPCGDTDTVTSQTLQRLLTNALLRPYMRPRCLKIYPHRAQISDEFMSGENVSTRCRKLRTGVSPMQLVFSRNPEIPGNLLSDYPDLIANNSMRHDRDAEQAARIRTIARTKLMLHSDNLNAKRALDTRPRVVPTFLPGRHGCSLAHEERRRIPGKRAHHGWRPGIWMGAVRGNYWDCTPRTTETSGT